MAAKFDFPSIDSCVQQSKAEFLKFQNYTASFADVRTMQDVCARFRFDTVSDPSIHMYFIPCPRFPINLFVLIIQGWCTLLIVVLQKYLYY